MGNNIAYQLIYFRPTANAPWKRKTNKYVSSLKPKQTFALTQEKHFLSSRPTFILLTRSLQPLLPVIPGPSPYTLEIAPSIYRGLSVAESPGGHPAVMEGVLPPTLTGR